MKRQNRRAVIAALVVAALTLACGRGEPPALDADEGPNGGRLLEDGGFAVELAVFERGVPPEFRAWVTQDGKEVDPARVQLAVELHRLGGRVDRIGFTPQGEFLRGDATVEEPHSFDVKVAATVDGREHRFEYASYEGRVTLAPEVAAQSGVETERAGPQTLRVTLPLHGRIAPNGDALVRIAPRYPGIVREIRKRLGDPVARDEVVAIVEGNDSLRPYEVRSRVAGTVIARDAAPGELATDSRPVLVVADLGTVWAELHVPRADYGKLRVGQSVRFDSQAGAPPTEGRLDYLSPVVSHASQTMLARTVLPNAEGAWRPGEFVHGEVIVDDAPVAVAVREAAVQTLRAGDVVFVRHGDVYEARPVELGRRDGEWVEVLSGLAEGDEYAAQGSFVLKADVGKSGAAHDH